MLSFLLFEEEWSLLFVDHDLESLEIGKVGSLCSGSESLWPSAISPFLWKSVFTDSLDYSSSSGSLEDIELVSGKGKSFDWVDFSGNSSSWSVKKNSVFVKNINDDSNFSKILSVVDNSDSSSLNKSSSGLYNISIFQLSPHYLPFM